MHITPMPPYFVVKLPRKRIDKVGSIFIPSTVQYMAYNLQCGEIVAIGSGAAKHFPEAKVGQTLIMHHFVEGESESDAKVEHLVHQTDTHNYYVVTAIEHNGKNCETYGVWDGNDIIPNKDYIFLVPNITVAKNPDIGNIDESINNGSLVVMESGLLAFSHWEDKREDKEAKMAMMKKEIEDLSKSGVHKQHIKQGIAEKERDLGKMSADLNKKKYIPFKIAYCNKELHASPKGKTAYVMNFAAATEVIFMEKSYIVANVKYVGLIH